MKTNFLLTSLYHRIIIYHQNVFFPSFSDHLLVDDLFDDSSKKILYTHKQKSNIRTFRFPSFFYCSPIEQDKRERSQIKNN